MHSHATRLWPQVSPLADAAALTAAGSTLNPISWTLNHLYMLFDLMLGTAGRRQYASFQDKYHLYMLFDLMLGGDLMDVLVAEAKVIKRREAQGGWKRGCLAPKVIHLVVMMLVFTVGWLSTPRDPTRCESMRPSSAATQGGRDGGFQRCLCIHELTLFGVRPARVWKHEDIDEAEAPRAAGSAGARPHR